MEDETAAQLTGVMFRDFGPEVDALVFGSLLAQLPVPLFLLLLLLQARLLGASTVLRGRICSAKRRCGVWSSYSLARSSPEPPSHTVRYSRAAEDGARSLLGCVPGAEPLKPCYCRLHLAEALQTGLHISRRFGDRCVSSCRRGCSGGEGGCLHGLQAQDLFSAEAFWGAELL